MSELVKDALDYSEEDDEVLEEKNMTINKVDGVILKKVIEFCTHYQEVEKMEKIETPLEGETLEEIVRPVWYANYCKGIDRQTMFKMVTAANYMNIQELLNLACLGTAVSIRGKSAEELRRIFNLPDPEPLANNDKSGDSDENDQNGNE